ncbi:phage tail protein [Metasolibacillus sp. FSL H7-0170]|uniref:phage tail protein n=1 Tax=Metasolibacillus sp. FSL H7-0170 TaxID=2921431 RepID=UPI003158A890
MAQYGTIITNSGLAQIANAQATQTKVGLEYIALGDGNGAHYIPTQNQSALVNEVWREPVANVTIDPTNKNRIIVDGVIPTTAGGFTIREIGVFDDQNQLIAVGQYPEKYKPQLNEGTAEEILIHFVIETNNADIVELSIDPSIIIASRKYVDEKIDDIERQFTKYLDDTALKDLTIYSGLNVIDASVKSPVNIKRIDGKTIVNHIPLFDSGAWSLLPTASVKAPNELEFNITGAAQNNRLDIQITPNETYTINGEISDTRLAFTIWDNAQSIIIKSTSDTVPFTFTVPNNINSISVYVGSGSAPNGTYSVKNLTLNKGSQVEPFVANVKGVKNPTIINKTNDTSLVVPTTLYDGEYVEYNTKGDLVKYRKWGEMELSDPQLIWTTIGTSNQRNGYRQVRTNHVMNTTIDMNRYLTNHIGKVVLNGRIGDPYPSMEMNYLNMGVLHIVIPNSESGWGDNYNPTDEEIKAYFLGWKMYNADGGYGGEGDLYNGTGSKGWAYRDPITTSKVNGLTGTLPTTQAPINSMWQPYRLIYEHAEPIQEVITSSGDLLLSKGDNDLQVHAGRIVNELNNPYLGGATSTVVYFNYDLFNPLEYKTGEALSLFENSKRKPFLLSISSNSDGTPRLLLRLEDYDPTNTYTIDYEPLYLWEVTAPIDAVQIVYAESLQVVVNSLVESSATQHDTVTRMLDTFINEGDGVEWIMPTLLNGTTQTVSGTRYTKDSSGMVHLIINLNTPRAFSPNEAIFLLPKGYRPNKTFYITSIEYNSSSDKIAGIISVGVSGVISTGITSSGKGALIAYATYKAEQ